MIEHENNPVPQRKTPMAGILFVIGCVFAVNLAILAYSVTKSVSTHVTEASSPGHAVMEGTSPTQPASGAQAPAPSAPPQGAVPSSVLLAAQPLTAAVVNPIILPESPVTQGMYLQHCAACHGLGGRGDGPAANQLYPRPRDFVDSPFRFAPRGGGHEALIEAIERTISLGVPRSSMPGFQGVLSEAEIAGLARYVASMRADQKSPAGMEQEIEVGTRPPTTPGLISRGASLYVSLGCVACHGETGHGDGPSSRGLVDSLSRPVRPADLTSGLFKGAQTPEDLVRTILKGIPGTPMVAFESSLATTNPDGTRNLTDAWAVVAFITSLKARTQPVGEASGARINVADALDQDMLYDPNNPAWLGIEPVEAEVKPIWQREETITHLSIRVVRDAERLSLCLEWRDPSLNILRDQDLFPDGAAVMFALGQEVPALPMGVQVEGHKAEAPVNIWHWQADRQFTASMKDQVNPHTAFQLSPKKWQLFPFFPESQVSAKIPTPSSPEYPILPSFLTARDAGSVQSQPELIPHAVLESNAEGFGSLTPQPTQSQNVWGAAIWSNGVWRVLLVRHLETKDEMDVALNRESRIPISFAVWDGMKHDRNGNKLISGWHWLNLTRGSPALTRQTQTESNPIGGQP